MSGGRTQRLPLFFLLGLHGIDISVRVQFWSRIVWELGAPEYRVSHSPSIAAQSLVPEGLFPECTALQHFLNAFQDQK